MNERQRNELLEQVNRTSATLGGSIPETVTVDDETVPLRAFYFEVADRGELDEEAQARVDDILGYLRRERLRVTQRIENDDIEYRTGQELVDRIQELDRAVNAFESLEEPSFGEQVRQERIQSAEELRDMLRQFGTP
jgi:hypothetical protein